MSQGLRPHFHQEYIGRSEQYYNKKKHLLILLNFHSFYTRAKDMYDMWPREIRNY